MKGGEGEECKIYARKCIDFDDKKIEKLQMLKLTDSALVEIHSNK